MIYVRNPTAEEEHELRRMTRQEIGRVALRAQMILLSAQGRSVPDIARLFEVDRKTVRFWMRRFDQHGPSGLYDEPRSGRPRLVTAAVRDKLVELVQQDPAESGHAVTFWTVAMLVLVAAKNWSIKLSASAVRQALHEARLAWSRPRLGMPAKTDPQKAAKQWAIAQAVIAAGEQGVVLYADESRIQLLPLIRAMWHWVGQQVRVPTPGTNVWRALFGALNLRNGRWHYLVREHVYADDFIVFLEHLLTVYTSETVILIVDNYSSHTARSVKAWLAEHPRLQLFYLPTYCSHLNPVEQIWLRLKGGIAANRLYGS
ncbi:MAG TPA: IS630 family transposase, partial [Rhizobiaceae bacterium]|nr:IS630 family transposase [Rhizobiaceae bacterium]